MANPVDLSRDPRDPLAREMMLQVLGPGGNVGGPTSRGARLNAITGGFGDLGFNPFGAPGKALNQQTINDLTRVSQQPGQWFVHAPQPEVSQPSGVRIASDEQVPGTGFVYENARTGERIYLPTDKDMLGGGGGGNLPIPQQQSGGSVGVPDISGGSIAGGQSRSERQEGSSSSPDVIDGQVVGINAGPGEHMVFDQATGQVVPLSALGQSSPSTLKLASQVTGKTIRTPDVSGSNTSRTVVTPPNYQPGTVYKGNLSSNTSQSGSSSSKDAIGGQVVSING